MQPLPPERPPPRRAWTRRAAGLALLLALLALLLGWLVGSPTAPTADPRQGTMPVRIVRRTPPQQLASTRAPPAPAPGTSARCEAPGLPEGAEVLVALNPLHFPPEAFDRTLTATVVDGEMRFVVPTDREGRGDWTVEGIARGGLWWPAGGEGEVVACTFSEETGFTLVHGTVVEEDGSPASDVRVEGCGGKVEVEEDGSFQLVAETLMPCVLATERGAWETYERGDPVRIVPVAGEDLVDVRLMVPHVPTPEEAAEQRVRLCASSIAQWDEMVASVIATTTPGPMRDGMLEHLDDMRPGWTANCDPDGPRTGGEAAAGLR